MQSKSKKVGQGFWERHSDAWKESGLDQRAYCEQEGIDYKSFIYRRNRLMRHLRKEAIHFIEARPIPAVINSPAQGLQLILPNGIRIGIGAEVGATLLQTVLAIASATSC